VEVVPWLWFLTLSQDCRIFQHKNVLDIVAEVFGEYPTSDYEVRCIESYAAREYCVQYRESDFDFVSRLLEEEGIYYFFEHSKVGHKLVLVDDQGLIKPCPVQSSFRVTRTEHAFLDEDVVTDLRREHVVNTERVTLRDYNFLQPSNNLQASNGSRPELEVYDYPGLYDSLSGGERHANLLLQERTADYEVVRGSGTCRTLAPGHTLTLKDYYLKPSNQEYMVVALSHGGSGGGYRSHGTQPSFHAEFVWIPSKIPYRPPRITPRPIVRGSQTAVVVGPSGEEIYTDGDGHGRVKVHFHWDRLGKKDQNSSCWLRVSHPWAGKSWGAVALPRIGHEVIVDFLEGNPDRPIVTGRVYNADMPHPYGLPDNKTQSGVKSRSSLKGSPANFNEIRMEDKKGEEHLYIHAEKDKQVVVEHDRTESVGHDETIDIGNDRTETVGHDESITIANNRTEKVGVDEEISIGKNRTETVGADERISIGKNRTETVGTNESITIGSNRTESVGKDETIGIGANRSEQVGKNEDVSVGQSRTHQIGKSDRLEVGKELLINVGDQIVIKTGSASITMKKNGDIKIKGKNIDLQGSGKIKITASSDVNIKGSKVTNN
jgi:type VI secretion system secreted protein VgrG